MGLYIKHKSVGKTPRNCFTKSYNLFILELDAVVYLTKKLRGDYFYIRARTQDKLIKGIYWSCKNFPSYRLSEYEVKVEEVLKKLEKEGHTCLRKSS